MSNLKVKGNANGNGTTTLQSADTNTNITLTLPSTAGASGDLLKSDGQGNLSFTAGLPVGATFYVPQNSTIPSGYLKFSSDTLAPVGTYPDLDSIITQNPPAFSPSPISIINRTPDSYAYGNDYFGDTVDISGNYLILGEGGRNDSKGGAFIYFYNGSSWELQQSIDITDPSVGSNAFYGISVAIDGDYAVLGTQEGYGVKIFKRSGTTWNEVAEIPHPNPLNPPWDNQFGTIVAMSNGRIAISNYKQPVPNPSDPGTNLDYVGTVWIYSGSDATWTLEATLVPPIIASSFFFGRSLALDGDNLIVGSPTVSSSITGAAYNGAVVSYSRSGGTWQQVGVNYATGSSGLGQRVAVSGDTIIATNEWDSWNGSLLDKELYVWSSPALGAPLITLNNTNAGVFGFDQVEFFQYGARNIALDNDTIIVGCPDLSRYTETNYYSNAGLVAVFNVDIQAATITRAEVFEGTIDGLHLGANLAYSYPHLFILAKSTTTSDYIRALRFHYRSSVSTITLKSLTAIPNYATAMKVTK